MPSPFVFLGVWQRVNMWHDLLVSRAIPGLTFHAYRPNS